MNISSITKKTAVVAVVLALPVVVGAQFTQGNPGEIGTFGQQLLTFLNDVIVPLLFAVALAIFIYGIFVFMIQSGGEDDSREKGRKYMLWGILGFVLMVSVWGITNLVASGLGFSNQESIDDFIPGANNPNP